MSVLWKTPLKSGFDGGFMIDTDEKSIIIGVHTDLLKINLRDGKSQSIKTNVEFANIVDVKYMPDKRVAVVDSDASIIYFGSIVDDQFKIEETIGKNKGSYPDVVKMHSYNNDLYVLTSNPSYLFKYNVINGEIVFIVGDGRERYSVAGTQGLRNGMYFPTDFTVTSNGIYITEANHRVIYIDKENILTVFAGSIRPGKGLGVNKCTAPLFAGLRGITVKNDNVYVVDSENNRVVSLSKNNKTCNILNITEKNGKDNPLALNYPTYIYLNKDVFYLIDQNNIRSSARDR
jgi:hypothetical protein